MFMVIAISAFNTVHDQIAFSGIKISLAKKHAVHCKKCQVSDSESVQRAF